MQIMGLGRQKDKQLSCDQELSQEKEKENQKLNPTKPDKLKNSFTKCPWKPKFQNKSRNLMQRKTANPTNNEQIQQLKHEFTSGKK